MSRLSREGPDRPGSRNVSQLRRLWRFLRPYRLAMAGALVALLVAAGAVLGLGQGLRYLVDRGFAAEDAALLDRALLVLFLVIGVMAAAIYARFSLVSWIGERVVADMRRAVYDRALRLSPGFYEVTKVGEVLSRLTADTAVLQTVVGGSVSMVLRNAIMFIGGTVMLAITSPRLAGLALLVVPLVLAPITLFGRRVRRLSRASQDRVADLGAQIEESLNNIRTVQAFGHEDVDRGRFGARVEDALATAVRRVRARAWMMVAVMVLTFGAIGIILWVGGRDVIAGRLSPGELSAFVFYAVVVASAVGALSEVVGDLQRAAGATERLFELLAVEPDIVAPAVPVPLPTPVRGGFVFRGVTFRYPSRPDHPALADFDLDVGAGETVALVGPSGAGKTTVFQLLLRFYDPQEGAIQMQGVDLRDLDPGALRRQIGLVPQEPVVFAANAWENIRYGRPDASDAEVRAAAEAAYATEFLDILPSGFDTFLGEKGVRLSGGQRQRVAIARAILRDPAILLLDEATSALDAESEHAVQAALRGLMRGRTTLIIAHRLATVRRADRIVVIDRGRVAGSGRHAELLADGGLYARLAALQFRTGTVDVFGEIAE